MSGDTRVAVYARWIDGVVASGPAITVPEPAPGANTAGATIAGTLSVHGAAFVNGVTAATMRLRVR